MGTRQTNPHEGHRERMRERVRKNGAQTLDTHELLEMLLYYTIPLQNTNEAAHALLERFGSFRAVLEASEEELKQVSGIGEKSSFLLTILREVARRYVLTEREKHFRFDTADKIGRYLLEQYVGETNECVYLMLLDNSLEMITCKKMFEGSVNSAALSPRELFDLAYAKHASAVVLAHNHPGGIAVPSSDDLNTTDQLAAGFHLLGIDMIEHFLITDNRYTPLMRGRQRLPLCRSDASEVASSDYRMFYGMTEEEETPNT